MPLFLHFLPSVPKSHVLLVHIMYPVVLPSLLLGKKKVMKEEASITIPGRGKIVSITGGCEAYHIHLPTYNAERFRARFLRTGRHHETYHFPPT